MTIIAGGILKERLVARYQKPLNPYGLALLFCLEKTAAFLVGKGQESRLTHIVAEARSPRGNGRAGREDRELLEEFQGMMTGRHRLQNGTALQGFELVFADKKTNAPGLQLADLVARPIGLKLLRPDQPNRAFDVIESKLIAKVFP